MISVIHPSSHFMGGAGARVPPSFAPAQGMMPSNSAGFTNMPTGPTMANYGHQLMMAKAGDPISSLYRRQDSGYTHHVSNSSSGDYQLRAAASRPSSSRSLSTSYKKVASTGSSVRQQQQRGIVLPPHGSSSSSKDYSKPLFVDCSIEYELPNAPKIPKNSQPILMIHPGYKARLQQKKECHQRGACQCNTTSQQPKRTAVKRSYATAMTNDFYKLHQQTSAPHHAYFDNSSTSSALEALAMQAAKRSRTMQMAEKQLFDHQQFFQQQQMQQAALRHYQQSYYRPDLRISSFQQITPPESLAFWQQQQQQQQQMMCRSACCTSNTSTSFKYSPPSMAAPAMCCYPMPPTPMVTNNNTAAPNAGFCLGCAQGKCQQVNKQKNNLGIMRSL